jgi:hypothetical protein
MGIPRNRISRSLRKGAANKQEGDSQAKSISRKRAIESLGLLDFDVAVMEQASSRIQALLKSIGQKSREDLLVELYEILNAIPNFTKEQGLGQMTFEERDAEKSAKANSRIEEGRKRTRKNANISDEQKLLSARVQHAFQVLSEYRSSFRQLMDLQEDLDGWRWG